MTAFACLAAAAPACAEPARIFRLPAEPVDSALVRFAVQAGVSVGGLPAPGCSGSSRPVAGVLTAKAALERLLPSGCTFEQVDARAFRILGRRTTPLPEPPAPAPSATELSEVIVTAEKRSEPLRGSPFAVSAFGAADIDRLGGSTFSAVALQIAGVAETNLGPGRNKIFIRGLSDGAFTGRTQSTVGLYLDEVPITYNAPDPDLQLVDVERVEVLRGPQGTLYGAGSIGGIVRIVPARPSLQAFTAETRVEGTVNREGEIGYAAEAVVNIPVIRGRAAIRGLAYVDDLPGYLDDPLLGRRDVNHGHRSGGRLSGLAEFGDGWTGRITLGQQTIEIADSQYVQTGRLVRETHVSEPHHSDFHVIAATLSHTGASADLRLSAAYIDHDIATRYDATGAFGLGGETVAAFDEDRRAQLWVAEGVAVSTGQSRLRWLAGAFAAASREAVGGVLDEAPSRGPTRTVFDRRDSLNEAALFGEATYDLTSKFTATVGGRLFVARVKMRADRFGLARPGLDPVRAHRTDRGFAPKVRLSYAFAPDVVVYAQAQDGYRAGGFNLPAAVDGSAEGRTVETFRPDRMHSYEVGGEASLLDRSLTLRAALFKAYWRDVQTDQFRASGLPFTLNIGDGSNLGLEVEALWRPDRHWRLRLSGLLDDPELTRTSNLFPARVDVGLPGVARRSGAMEVGYAWSPADGLEADLSVQAAYVGRSFLTFDGATASTMGDYGQARVALSLRGRRWAAQAFVDNVTDTAGDTFAFGNPFSRGRTRQSTPLPPRTFGLAIRRSF